MDRPKSVEVLKKFLDDAPEKVREEAGWLREIQVDCVLSDAAFLGWYGFSYYYLFNLTFFA